jgi:hypothetical protein
LGSSSSSSSSSLALLPQQHFWLAHG